MMRVFVIGQSPRPEIEAEIEAEIAAAAPGMAIRLEGALDGLPRPDRRPHRRRRRPLHRPTLRRADHHLESPSHSPASPSPHRRRPRPPLLHRRLQRPPRPRRHRPTLQHPQRPSRIPLPTGELGLFVPLPEQVTVIAAERTRPGLHAIAIHLRPISDAATIDQAAARMAAETPDLVIMDCMSYTSADKARLERALRCPVLLSIAVAARAAASLIPEPPCGN